MFLWIKGLFKPKSLRDYVRETKKVKIKGIIFNIKKIDTINHLEGSKVMLSVYQTYEQKRGKSDVDDVNMTKIRGHMGDVILAGVARPKITRKESGDGTSLKELFLDLEMCTALYEEIMAFTYGKKKMKKLKLNT